MLNQPLLQAEGINRRRLTEQAINLALQSKWEQAAEINRRLVTHFRDDAEAYNRLGKALTELGQYAEARDAYQHAIDIDKSNNIARKNLERLTLLTNNAPPDAPRKGAQERINPRLFIEETGKTGTTVLTNTAPPTELARLTTGDVVYLKQHGRTLDVESAAGVKIGQVEPKLGQRLINFMLGGNRYAAALTSVDENGARIIVRETYQDPSQAGKVSFPVRADTGAFRGYTKDTLFKYDDEDDEDESGDEGDTEFGTEREHDHDEQETDFFDDHEEV
jgi:tetratricopeptide (TPR) repeat protein